MLQKVEILVLFVFLGTSLFGNHLDLGSTVKVANLTETDVTLEVTVTWENSWRDNYNNDAAWIFLKYRTTTNANWKHVILSEKVEVSPGYTTLPGRSSAGITGMMVYRDAVILPPITDDKMRVSTIFRVTWNFSAAGVTRQMFDEQKVFLMSQGVEMVYVPYGPYVVGDGISTEALGDENGAALEITKNDAMENLYADGNNYPLRENFANGFNGFYVMKYEVSQEQYMAFLNALTKAEQLQLLGNRVGTLKKGDYIFGSTSDPSKRNGIIVAQPATGNDPIVFDNNLAKDDKYGSEDDGQTLACNYMSIKDLLAYSAWSGLRPMSEMEYEKICRPLSPMKVVPGEYAWGNTSFAVMTGLVPETEGRVNERPMGGNANAQGSLGPVRCGGFAFSSTSRETAGAGFSGVMELAGNVKELCAHVTNIGFLAEKHGNGVFELNTWGSPVPSYFGARGGGFASQKERLRVSDREEMDGYITSTDQRDSTVGFRAMHMLNTADLTVDAGTIRVTGSTDLVPVVCSGTPFVIESVKPAAVKQLTGVVFRYEWYLNNKKLPDVTGASLSYPTGIFNTNPSDETYVFKRKAICYVNPEGVESDEIRVQVPGRLKFVGSKTSYALTCGVGELVTARLSVSGKFQWKNGSNGKVAQDWTQGVVGTYTPTHAAFGYAPGDYVLRCVSDRGGCLDSLEAVVKVTGSCGVSLSNKELSISTSTNATSTIATLCGSGTITWIYKDGTADGKVLQTDKGTVSTYKPDYAHFDYKVGDMVVICRVQTGEGWGSCISTDEEIPVSVKATLGPGEISGPTIACGGTGSTVTIANKTLAGVLGMDLKDIKYAWYHNDTELLAGEEGPSLNNYPIPANATDQTITHTFKRIAKSVSIATTSNASNIISVRVPGVLTLTTTAITLASGVATPASVEAKRSLPGTFLWKFGVKELGSAAAYTPNHADFNNVLGNGQKVICQHVTTDGGCVASKVLSVNVSATLAASTITTGSTAICAGTLLSITGNAVIVNGMTGVTPTYTWYHNSTVVSNAVSLVNYNSNLTPGTTHTFYRKVTAAGLEGSSNTLTITVNPSTVITNHPSVQMLCQGGTISLSVGATGAGTLSYQWQKAGVNIAGANSAAYSKAGAVPADGGDYRCVVTGTCGAPASNAATVTVNPSTVITAHPSNAAVCSGKTATFSVTATGTAPLSYRWSNGSTSSSLSTGSAGTYSCTVTGSCGTATSTGATLTVYSLPIGTVSGGGQVCSGATAVVNLSFSGGSGSGYVYQLNTDGSDQTATSRNLGVGTYTLASLRDSRSCVATSLLGSAVISVKSCGPTDGSGATYPVVIINGKEWMASNLNDATKGGWNNAPYGRLYTFSQAQSACPTGYRLPTNAEFEWFRTAYGNNAGTYMKSTSGWQASSGIPQGNGVTGFNGLPGGLCNSSGGKGGQGYGGYWWSSEGNYWHLNYGNTNLYGPGGNDGYGYSVRCVRN